MSPAESIELTAVVGSVTPPGRLRRAVDEALARAQGAQTELIDLAERQIPFADGRPATELGGDTAAVIAALARADAVLLVLAFFGAHPLPTAVYLSGRDFADGRPSQRAEHALDAVISSAVSLAGALRERPALGPMPLAAGF
jgi:FMN reductase